jgi:hypothetical protein
MWHILSSIWDWRYELAKLRVGIQVKNLSLSEEASIRSSDAEGIIAVSYQQSACHGGRYCSKEDQNPGGGGGGGESTYY